MASRVMPCSGLRGWSVGSGAGGGEMESVMAPLSVFGPGPSRRIRAVAHGADETAFQAGLTVVFFISVIAVPINAATSLMLPGTIIVLLVLASAW